MFGYSRGACKYVPISTFTVSFNGDPDVVRAVAGLLHNIQAMTSDKTCFEKDYQRGLDVFQDLTRDGGPARPGEASRHRTGFLYLN